MSSEPMASAGVTIEGGWGAAGIDAGSDGAAEAARRCASLCAVNRLQSGGKRRIGQATAASCVISAADTWGPYAWLLTHNTTHAT